MSGFKQPRYTQTPNQLFDEYMKDFSDPELRVCLAVIRGTFGFHRLEYVCSLREMQRKTGLSRNSVLSAAESLEKIGLIRRELDGNKSAKWVAIIEAIPDQETPEVEIGGSPHEPLVPEVVHPMNLNGSPHEPLLGLNIIKDINTNSEMLSEFQRLFLTTFGAKRFKNKTQAEAVKSLEIKYGPERLSGPLAWAAKQGMALGRAISAIETAVVKWDQPKGPRNNNGAPRTNVETNYENIRLGVERMKARGNQP